MSRRMRITEALIRSIRLKLHQPKGYSLVLKDVIGHGTGIIVNYIVEPVAGRAVEHRCAGFIEKPNAEFGIACCFDMIIPRT